VITSLYHLDTPLVRCRIGDRAIYREGRSCGCGRAFSGVETASIARTDDMKKVKGVNVWPQAVDDILFARPAVDEYQVVLGSAPDGGDVATVRVMPKTELSVQQTAELADGLSVDFHRQIGFRFNLEVVPPGGLDLNEWKARRWLDQRAHVRQAPSLLQRGGI
jgi:phenylacetate-CoA ligase